MTLYAFLALVAAPAFGCAYLWLTCPRTADAGGAR